MNKLNTTIDENKKQDLNKKWVEEIEKHLPENLDESAKTYTAMQRKRGVLSASHLLRIFLIYAVSQISFKMLALSADALSISSISDTAWHKRLSKSVPWLKYLLNSILSKTIKTAELTNSKNRNVYLIDGSNFKQEGKSKMIYRIHMSYHLNSNCMSEIKVTDHHTAESFTHYSMKEGDIFLADAGYGTSKNYKTVLSNSADVIMRISPNHFKVYDDLGRKMDLRQLLTDHKKVQKTSHVTEDSILEIKAFVTCEKKFYPVRILACRLPEDKIPAAKKRKRQKSQKNGSRIKEETLEYAEWTILATSLGVDYFKEEILHLYRSRWQVELLFKRIKQNLNAHSLRASTEKYVLALIHLWLIVWALTEKQVLLAEQYRIQKNIDRENLSIWDLCSFFYLRITTIIGALWTLLIDPSNMALLEKYLSLHKSRRTLQNYDFRMCILDTFIC